MQRDEQPPRPGQRVWDRPASGRNGPVGGLAIMLLAIFGALIVGLSIVEGSVGEAGARIDSWIDAIRSTIGL